MNRTTKCLAFLASMALGIEGLAAPAPAGAPVGPSTLHIILDKYPDECDRIQIGSAAPVPIRKKAYLTAEVWPGSVPMAGFGCRGQDRHPFLFQVGEGEQYIYFGRALGGEYDHWEQPGIAQGRALTAKRRQAGSISLEQTSPPIDLLGGKYTGPTPWILEVSLGAEDYRIARDREVRGRLVYPDGLTFTGRLKGKELIGGEIDYPDGSRYIGELAKYGTKGQFGRVGTGRLIEADGSVFAGEFKGNRANGIGVCSAPGGRPESCQRTKGKPAPLPSAADTARERVRQQEEADMDRAIAPTAAELAKSRKASEALQEDIRLAPQRVRQRDARMEKECSCYLHGCLEIRDSNAPRPTEAQKRLWDLQDQQRTRQCRAWDSGRSVDLDTRVEAEIASLRAKVAREDGRRLELERQMAAQRKALAQKQAAERAEKERIARANEEKMRQNAIDGQKKRCEATFATYGFACGCSAFLPNAPKERADNLKGDACPA